MLPLAFTLIVGLFLGSAAGYAAGGRESAPACATTARRRPKRITNTGSHTAHLRPDGAIQRAGRSRTAAGAAARRGATAARGSASCAWRCPSGDAAPSCAPNRGREDRRRGSSSARRRRGAGVTVNGKWRGRTPLTMDALQFGTYAVRVVQPGFVSSREDVTLSARQPMRTLSIRCSADTPPSAPSNARRGLGAAALRIRRSTATHGPPSVIPIDVCRDDLCRFASARRARINRRTSDGHDARQYSGHSDRFARGQARARRSPRLDHQHARGRRGAGPRDRFARTHTMKATLALENGSWYEGEAAGAAGETGGEVVFNTSLTGYQEILTDPSYSGQIVTMTCPGDRQLRHRRRRRRVARAASGRVHHSRRIAGREQLAIRQHAARIPGAHTTSWRSPTSTRAR